jgi:hypothetical protein
MAAASQIRRDCFDEAALAFDAGNQAASGQKPGGSTSLCPKSVLPEGDCQSGADDRNRQTQPKHDAAPIAECAFHESLPSKSPPAS